MDAIDKLRELTDKLPPVPKLIDFMYHSNEPKSVTYKIEGGTAISYALLSQDEISVAKTFVSSGGKFPLHKHDEKEVIIVFSGVGMLEKNGEKLILRAGDCILFEPNEPHTGRALEDLWFIAIAVPYSKDYPDERK